MFKKLKSNKGSISVITLFTLALTILFIGIISHQILNQIKMNKNTESYIQSKYLAEAGIEQGIFDYIKSIELNGIISDDINKFTDLNIIKQYLLQAKYINNNQGIIEDTIDNIISNINQQINSNKINLDTIKGLIVNLLNHESLNSNNSVKKLVKEEILIANDYLSNMMESNKTPIFNLKYIIDKIKLNIDSLINDISKDYKISGNEKEVHNYLRDLKNKILDISNILNSIEQNPSDINNIKNLGRYIVELNEYIDIIKKISDIKDYSILDKTFMENKYGNREYNNLIDILLNRVTTVSLELNLMNVYIQEIVDSISKSIYYNNRLFLNLNYKESSDDIFEINPVYNEFEYDVLSIKKESNIKYEIVQKGSYIKIPIIIDSVSDKYKLQVKVKIVVKDILSEDNYNIDYEIINWKKK